MHPPGGVFSGGGEAFLSERPVDLAALPGIGVNNTVTVSLLNAHRDMTNVIQNISNEFHLRNDIRNNILIENRRRVRNETDGEEPPRDRSSRRSQTRRPRGPPFLVFVEEIKGHCGVPAKPDVTLESTSDVPLDRTIYSAVNAIVWEAWEEHWKVEDIQRLINIVVRRGEFRVGMSWDDVVRATWTFDSQRRRPSSPYRMEHRRSRSASSQDSETRARRHRLRNAGRGRKIVIWDD